MTRDLIAAALIVSGSCAAVAAALALVGAEAAFGVAGVIGLRLGIAIGSE